MGESLKLTLHSISLLFKCTNLDFWLQGAGESSPFMVFLNFLIKKLSCTWFTVIKGSFIWLQGVSRFSCYSFTIKTVDKSLQAQHHSITAGKSELESWHGTLKSWTSSYDHSTRAVCFFFHCLPTCPTHLSLCSCLTEQQCFLEDGNCHLFFIFVCEKI